MVIFNGSIAGTRTFLSLNLPDICVLEKVPISNQRGEEDLITKYEYLHPVNNAWWSYERFPYRKGELSCRELFGGKPGWTLRRTSHKRKDYRLCCLSTSRDEEDLISSAPQSADREVDGTEGVSPPLDGLPIRRQFGAFGHRNNVANLSRDDLVLTQALADIVEQVYNMELLSRRVA